MDTSNNYMLLDSDLICELIYFYLLLTGNITGKLFWGALDDVVMGGVSESGFQVDPTGSEDGGPTGLFKGICLCSFHSLINNSTKKPFYLL